MLDNADYYENSPEYGLNPHGAEKLERATVWWFIAPDGARNLSSASALSVGDQITEFISWGNHRLPEVVLQPNGASVLYIRELKRGERIPFAIFASVTGAEAAAILRANEAFMVANAFALERETRAEEESAGILDLPDYGDA